MCDLLPLTDMEKKKDSIREFLKNWRLVSSSAIFRLIVIVLAVVIPLNLLTLVLGHRVITEVERQISMETENALKMYMAQIDSAIENMSNALASVAVDDADYRRLCDKDVNSSEEFYRQVQCVVDLQLTLKEKESDNSMIDGVFAFFPEKDYFIQPMHRSDSAKIRGRVEEEIQSGNGPLYARGRLVDANGIPVLLRMFQYRGGWLGWWIPLDTLGEKLRYSGEEIIAIADLEGYVSYSSDPELQKLELDETYRSYGGTGYTLAQTRSDKADMVLVQIVPKSKISSSLPWTIQLLQILSFATLLIVPILMYAIQRLVIAPISKLTGAMERIEAGDLNYRIQVESRGSEFERINRNFNHMMDEVADLKVSVYEEQLKAQKIRLGFLSQQIKPHFILNALNILYSYEPEEFPLIQRMIMLLSRYLRYSLNANQDFVPLGKEMEHLRNYFSIQQTRFVRTFRAEIQFDEELSDCLIPPLLIQSFAENAIKHGLVPGKIVDIIVFAKLEAAGRVCVKIEDTGVGISDEALMKIDEFRKTRVFSQSLGVGIQNSIDRISLLYGDDAELTIHRGKTHGTIVEIHIPYWKEEQHGNEGNPG